VSKRNTIAELNPEIREILMEMGAGDAYKCYQCAKCTSACPWFQVGTYEFLVFRYTLETVLGLVASSEEKEELAKEVDKIYRCVGCEACLDQCPQGVNLPNILRAARRILCDFGSYPDALKSVVRKIKNVGNPLGEPREKRADWAEGLNVKAYRPGMEWLYFPCCIPAYDPRARKTARVTAKMLAASGISFGILGVEENCCGETIRRIGAESAFVDLAKSNIATFKDAGVKKILVTSPHCFNTFKKDYPEFNAGPEVLHATQFFAGLIENKTIIPKKEYPKRVVYHDSCRLGRQNGIYDEPRKILSSIPGLELLEVADFSHHLSLCCGAGSGGLFLDWPMGERMVDIRIKQLLNTGADVIAVACPYCLNMFEETVKALDLDTPVMDVAEILYESTSESE
jgi:Fe-S oxidoreductase